MSGNGDTREGLGVELRFVGDARRWPRELRRARDPGTSGGDPRVVADVEEIIADVTARGDAALLELAARLDGAELDAIEVDPSHWDTALEELDPAATEALREAARAIESVHRTWMPTERRATPRPGVEVGRRPIPLSRVGAYAPGGRAAYPSSVLMCVVPARVAGVGEVIVCSPPGPEGLPSAAVRAACAIAGADRLFALGGAGAVAAMALGTSSVPRVDKIVGPGNAWVEEAKIQLGATVRTDCPAGPSELLILADGTADADLVAAELLAQAEHDPRAAVILVTPEPTLGAEVVERLGARLSRLPDATVAREALAAHGQILECDDLDEAVAIAEEWAPEHLLVLTRDPGALLERLRHAGSIFLGPSASVTFGDYTTGANHVLPTAGRARSMSGLGVDDFLRWTTWQRLTPGGAASLVRPTATLARLEGLPAHAAAAELHGSDPGSGSPATGGAGGPASGPRRRSALRGFSRYAPEGGAVELELGDNTNLWGSPPAVGRLLPAEPPAHRYPSLYGDELKEAVSDWLGVTPECVATGCGSDDMIDAAVRAFTEPGDEVAFQAPTFSMVPRFALLAGARPRELPATDDFHVDVEALAATGAAIAYVCSPNNPTGTQQDPDRLRELAGRHPGLLLIDEAYVDFSDVESLASWAGGGGRAVVLRTFSKAWGLAGLRAGCAVGPPAIIEEIEKARGPYKLNAAAEVAAAAAVREDRAWVRDLADDVRRGRDLLSGALEARGLHPWPTAANFVLAGVPAGRTADGLAAGLRRRGIGVRPFPDLPVAGDALRITVGPEAARRRLLAALDDILADGGEA